VNSITAENLGLVHPIRAKTSGSYRGDGKGDKVIRRSDGGIVGVRALHDLNFKLQRGTRVGLIGKNGAGKTSLLRVLAGIVTPTSGTLTIEGRATNLININLGTKNDASGHRNITLQGLAHGFSRLAIEEKRQAIAEFSELGEFLDLPVNTYSAGMRMRLSFAIATSFDPEILLLDEWLSAGDESFKRKAAARMDSFVERAGILVLASHSLGLLEKNCDTAFWLDDGILRDQGPVADVWAAYKSTV